MNELLIIFITCGAGLLLVMLGMYLQSCSIRRRLTALLRRICLGDLSQTEDFVFLETGMEQLCGPFTVAELRRVAGASEMTVRELTVEPLQPLLAVFGSYIYHIRGCFEGLDAAGQPFRVERDGWLRIWCGMRRGYFRPCITGIVKGKDPEAVS